jgi:hypothetical protein
MTPFQAAFPATRTRRTRMSGALRAMVAENTLSPADLIWPLFVRDGDGVEEPVPSMPGVFRRSIDKVVEAAREAADLGIPAVCLFPFTSVANRTADCAEAWNPDNLSNRATRAIKAAVPGIAVMTDVALDPYSDTGHDGYVVAGEIVNDATVEALVKQALSQAEAGVDIIGPSDMMDGRVGAIRAALEGAGHHNVAIMAYSAKYASAFYGPFREAVGAGAAPHRARPERGGRYGDGQAGDALSRYLSAGKGEIRRADLRLSGLGRICDDHGGGTERLDRRRTRDDGKPHVLQAGGLRRGAELFRARRRAPPARLGRAREPAQPRNP